MAQDKSVKVKTTVSAAEAAEDAFSPLVDIYEKDDGLVLVADVPGASKGDISVQVDKGVLTLAAEARFDVPGEAYSRTYLSFEPGRFFRAFALSDEIDRDRITATVSKGVLTVELPKAEAARSRKIEIKVLE
ncbi:MAG: hypothetical protein AMJ81_01965 [Phycisphaerae bacterium SM23_33]|jgi:HSP20 family protein|nr:MAG: hypothetical protein AMJ81_01965 [Phycisphaerae bacterium SM23_33]